MNWEEDDGAVVLSEDCLRMMAVLGQRWSCVRWSARELLEVGTEVEASSLFAEQYKNIELFATYL